MCEIQKVADQINEIVVGFYEGQPVKRAEYAEAFAKVANQENWKLPIEAQLPIANEREKHLISQAVIFFCGCIPEIEEIEAGQFMVKAPGYYVAVGA